MHVGYRFFPKIKRHRVQTLRRVFSVAMLALLTGCATPLITNTPEFEAKIRHDVPLKDEKIIFRHEASLILGSDGFDVFDLLAERFSVGDGRYFEDKLRPYVPFVGVVVLTDKAYRFLRFDKNKQVYRNTFSMPYTQMRNVELRTLGLGRRLVITVDKGTFTTEVINGDHVNQEQSQQAYETIRQHIQNK